MGGFLKKYIRYWNTIRYLKTIQFTARLKKISGPSNVNLLKNKSLQKLEVNWIPQACIKQSMFDKEMFCFLNKCQQVANRSDWNNSNWDKLWVYNLHYFDDLMAIDANKRIDWHHNYIQRWTEENLPFTGNGWEPFPTSLRIVNWIKWSLAGNTLNESWIYSLNLQARFLSKNTEKHLLGNHLFKNLEVY